MRSLSTIGGGDPDILETDSIYSKSGSEKGERGAEVASKTEGKALEDEQ